MAQGNLSSGQQGFCLAALTLLALLIHALTTLPAPLAEETRCDGAVLPHLQLTGMRYYLRKHSRLCADS